MATELGGAKLIAPFYGTSLYVWSSVLAVTLGGLTIGYYAGGRATEKYKPVNLLALELLIACIWMVIMPFIALYIMPLTVGLGVRMGSLVSSMLILMPALICMGMVSPTIIQLANKHVADSGKTAGTVYAISTVGGIFMTILLGFYGLPELGIRISLWISALPLLGFAIFILPKTTLNKNAVILTILGVGMFSLISKRDFKAPSSDFSFLYKEEGMLGQLAVLENPIDANTTHRHLFINHIAQTWVNVDSVGISKWKYPHRFSTIASVKPAQSDALLIGLGGGSVANEFTRLGFNLDVVELDERVVYTAKEYFGLQVKDENVIIDDGRHYVQNTDKRYDVILIDVLNGENQPHHLFTKEAVSHYKEILNTNGILMVNLQGELDGRDGRAARSVYKTLQVSGFDIGVYRTKGGGDIHFYATTGVIDLAKFDVARQNSCCRAQGISLAECIKEVRVDTLNADILVDDIPSLAYHSAHSNEGWRKTALDAILKRQIESDYPFFH